MTPLAWGLIIGMILIIGITYIVMKYAKYD